MRVTTLLRVPTFRKSRFFEHNDGAGKYVSTGIGDDLLDAVDPLLVSDRAISEKFSAFDADRQIVRMR
jgi:hypothetical protein